MTNDNTATANGTTNGAAPAAAPKVKTNSPACPAPFAPYGAPGAPGYHEYIPAQMGVIGSLLPVTLAPQNAPENVPRLFEKLTIRGMEMPHRMLVSPMCQYSAGNGHVSDHHLVHLGSMTMRGWATGMLEATAVVPEGRISPEDVGIWDDSHVAGLKRIVDYVHSQGGTLGIQLAHAGRKASTIGLPAKARSLMDGWSGGDVATKENGGWADNTYGPSAISYHEPTSTMPKAASLEYIEDIKEAYRAAVERCKAAGFDYIELHGAHGYWLHEFCDPISNHRTDAYGGSFENRLRLPLEITRMIRAMWDKPLFYRVSASDWLEPTGPERLATPAGAEEYAWWGLEQTTLFAAQLRDAGVDLLDVSSAGASPAQAITTGPGYQVPFAAHIKKHVPGLLVGAVGLITTPELAEEILQKDQADVVFFGREILRNIDFPLKAAEALNVAALPAGQYAMAWLHMTRKRNIP